MSFAEPHKLGQRPWNKDAFEALKSSGAPGPAGRLQILAPIRRVQLPEGTIYDLLTSGGRVALVDEAHVEARPSGDGVLAGDAVLGREAVVALPPKSKSSPSPATTVSLPPPPRTMSSPAKASTKSLPARAQNHVHILGPGQHLGRARFLDRAVGSGLGRRAQQPHGGQRQPDDACDCKEPLSSPATFRLEGPRARSSSRHRRTQPARYTGDVGRARRRRTSGLPISEAPTILAWVGVRGFVRSFEFGVTERRRV
jgi:hypothetical protein